MLLNFSTLILPHRPSKSHCRNLTQRLACETNAQNQDLATRQTDSLSMKKGSDLISQDERALLTRYAIRIAKGQDVLQFGIDGNDISSISNSSLFQLKVIVMTEGITFDTTLTGIMAAHELIKRLQEEDVDHDLQSGFSEEEIRKFANSLVRVS